MPERTSSNCSAGSWWWSPCSSSTVRGPTLTGPGRAVLRRRDAHRHRCPVGGSRLPRGRSYGSGPDGPSVRRPGCSGRPAWPPPSRSRRVPRRCRRARRSPPGADSCPDTAGPPGPAQHTDRPGPTLSCHVSDKVSRPPSEARTAPEAHPCGWRSGGGAAAEAPPARAPIAVAACGNGTPPAPSARPGPGAVRRPAARGETSSQWFLKICPPTPVAEFRRPMFTAPTTGLTWPGPGFSLAPRATSR